MTHLIDLKDASVLVTGGTGSFGQQFVRAVLDLGVRRLAILSRDELKQSEMAKDPAFADPRLRFFLGDVRDRDRLEMAFRDVNVVVHAAALKQVPAAEYNPFEFVRTNIIGSENVARAAMRCGVDKVIFLSTDKAVNPINLYGATKLCAEKIFLATNSLSGPTKFSIVRYGNVLNSRGSVVPLFRQLITEGGDEAELPITHRDMTRFLLTLQQGVDFVLSSLRLMRGSEVFIPKLPSARVATIAWALGPRNPLKMVGVRPGEKIHETLLSSEDVRHAYDAGDRYIICAIPGRLQNEFKVPEGFTYDSQTNPNQLEGGDLIKLLETAS